MKDEDKRRFDALSARRSWAWTSFDRRREFEWKVSIGVWTALSASIGILLTKDVPIPSSTVKYGGIVVVVALFCLHTMFSLGLAKAQKTDRDRAQFYDDLLDKALDVTEPKPDEVKIGLWNYSHGFQITVTLLLGTCLVLLIFSK